MDDTDSSTWVDISEEFLAASSHLKLGELIHCETFGLYDAMSAIELMDEKMDVGMSLHANPREILNFSDAVERGLILVENIPPDLQVAIFDKILCSVVNWMDGQTLAQTLFSCLYLHNPGLVKDTTFKAMCFGLLRMAELMRYFIIEARVFEEEDFQQMCFNFSFHSAITDKSLLSILKEAIDISTRAVKNNMQCILRLQFLHQILSILLALKSKQEIEIRRLPQSIEKILYKLVKFEEQSQYSFEDFKTKGFCYQFGFDTLINQRLLPPSFPEYNILYTWKTMITFFQRFLEDLKIIVKVFDDVSLDSVISLCSNLSSSNSSVLSRSMLQYVLDSPHKILLGHDVADLVKESVITTVSKVPFGDCLQDPTVCKVVDVFLQKSINSFVHIIRAFGNNRARLREQLAMAHYELAQLQMCADATDNAIMSYSEDSTHLSYLSSFVFLHNVRIMMNYVLMGFELKLYSDHEYLMIFWYLSEYLINWNLSLQRNCDEMSRSENLENGNHYNEGYRSSHCRKDKKFKKLRGKREEQNQYTIVHLQGLRHMFIGYYRLLLALKHTNTIPRITQEIFNNEELRFNRRFEQIGMLNSLAPARYDAYKEATCSAQNLECQNFLISLQSFQNAKCVFERSPMISSSENYSNLAKTNMIVVKLLHNKLKPPSSLRFDHNPLYPHLPLVKFK